jgi:hypothetical protein
MPSVTKFHSRNYDVPFNVLLIVLLLFTVIGNLWLVLNEIYSGVVYFTFFTGGIISYVIILTLGGEGIKTKLGGVLRAPFSVSLGLASISYLAGWVAPFVLQGIISSIGKIMNFSFSITSLSIPLFTGAGSLFGIGQSFAQVEIAESIPWKLFTIVFSAGTGEEFIFSFVTMFIFSAVLLLALRGVDKPLGLEKDNFIIGTAILLSTILFVGAHSLNGTYTLWYMFLIAGIFKLVSLVGIYYYGLFLTFFMGYHSANNQLYLIETDGFISVLNGFISWYGVLFVLLFLAIIGYIAFTWGSLRGELQRYIKS